MIESKKDTNGSLANYGIIRNRLIEKSSELKGKIDKLNNNRIEIFGKKENRILKNLNILTSNNCIPRDIFSLGNKVIFAYNVSIGLKTVTNIEDVFTIYKYENETLEKDTFDLLFDEKFISEFKDLYKYYKDSFFSKFYVLNGFLYMIFQNGQDFNNIKSFKWLINENSLEYVGNRFAHEIVYSNQSEISWKKTSREDHVVGEYPHISIADKVFVEAINGDLTLKIENNTKTGKGIYSEPVENPDQNLDDAEIYYCVIENIILLKIKPYKENAFRYLIFNQKTREVFRNDSIEKSILLLPESQGLIMPNGIVRQSGGFTKFEIDCSNCVFQEKISSVNGEDFEFVFYNQLHGEYYLYSYNIIENNVNSPLNVNGFTHFPNGHLLVFKAEMTPKKSHTLQIWETSFKEHEEVANKELEETLIFKLGNKAIVEAIASLNLLYRLVNKEDSYSGLYVDIVKDVELILNSYYWLDKEEIHNIKESLSSIKEIASLAIGEYEKVKTIKETNFHKFEEIKNKLEKLFKTANYETFDSIIKYVNVLNDFRVIRGEILGLKELEFLDLDQIEGLIQNLRIVNDKISIDCVNYLLEEDSLKNYILEINKIKEEVPNITKVIHGKELETKLVSISENLELLTNIINNLKIDDTTKIAEIVNKISELFSNINQIKAKLSNLIENFDTKERETEFFSKLNLITQSVSNYLNLSDSVEKCDSNVTKLVLQLDELESKFSDFEEFIPKLIEKREEILTVFTSKKQLITENKNKKINSIYEASNRIFKGLENRLKLTDDIKIINEIFSSDLMIEKIRDNIDLLISLDDTTKANEIESKLKNLKENSIRQLNDKKELFVDGNTIKFGENHFLINTQEPEFTMIKKDNNFYFHISSTDFFEKVEDSRLQDYSLVWDQEILSENDDVYRGEYLAFSIINQLKKNNSLESLNDDYLKKIIKEYVEKNFEGYFIKGIHDDDGFKIVKGILELEYNLNSAIYNPKIRGIALLFFNYGINISERDLLTKRIHSLKSLVKFGFKTSLNSLCSLIEIQVNLFFEKYPWLNLESPQSISEYLVYELVYNENFVISLESKNLHEEFMNFIIGKNAKNEFLKNYEDFKDDLQSLYILFENWIELFINEKRFEKNDYFFELLVTLILNDINERIPIRFKSEITVDNLIGSHKKIEKEKMKLNYHNFMINLEEFLEKKSSKFAEFQKLKIELLNNMKNKLKFDELKSKTLSSFVRNKLIDKVYLPLIGNNFAKQIGVAGKNKRTDNMGMLLLISPPGYGKTTLIEYLANRLNMLLIKINCPTLGNQITSLDPQEAKNLTGKEELEKLNLAFEIGENIIIYLDDIQHSNPEFLQKFISLCDGQRKIDGVYKGNSKTYQFKGKKVAIVMAGNPYTENGEKFQIPDMLANRADVYNLGDMIGENEEAFKLSYIENAITSNLYLNKIFMKNPNDIYKFIKAIELNSRDSMGLEGMYSESEISDNLEVLDKMIKVREEILIVNKEYINSAGQNDKYRVEPPFKLQGSYRNMNKISEKIVPIMNEKELRDLIERIYENDSQTLASDAEASLLKFKEITNRLDSTNISRWNHIKNTYLETKKDKSNEKMIEVIQQLDKVNVSFDTLNNIFKTLGNIKDS
ncbi:MAG: DNA repair ATPase [Fusobacteriaceae bacterium]|nr:DNA repair ATPase [Fusobacteriaceae bacterium]